ncbi:MAG: diapophytoene dehydrogenase [Bacteroidetes bacterium GWF2_42_66]|nr:MAG: diapophytoene dehydrogenase [Bacteroidetes bacterium GWA2_42_15]OFX98661.1 MAG: diapophytoene dehydrogenase [Bacteroidetes bacterium GWE2_42_39]OFY43141.1 MAG: diapophytoene dehydrogenase [Bacteroidetes bacterium GWF2_42_66]HBL77009.1 diapophytoene dehydrogenase [Prolixibacteraceae bacterium]HCR90099.1 diapophytoene dehydrogenase [Prolixibacteraceae bacterium]
MSEFKIQMPKLGESVQEATITKWFVKEGDRIEEDDSLFEVATDKVDSEIPSPVEGIIKKIFHPENALVPVGEIVAIITMDGDDDEPEKPIEKPVTTEIKATEDNNKDAKPVAEKATEQERAIAKSGRFYSPLVMSIARTENVSLDEMESIQGSGQNGRVQKNDILKYLEDRKSGNVAPVTTSKQAASAGSQTKIPVSIGGQDQIIEMDRVRKLIAEHMVMSKQVSPHVTSVVEADVTNLVLWRNNVKDQFSIKYGDKITFMPVFIEAVARALSEFPLVNSSVDGTRIIMKKDINVAIAVAKPDGNLVVPVIKNAEQKNLVGLAKNLNQLAEAARTNKLTPEDYQGGTFTITNFGSFRNIIGTPIINQPQVAILATGSIEKKPAVMETPTGDAIVVRHKMFLSLSYDHRIIDGALGGAFLRRIADILEEFDINREV